MTKMTRGAMAVGPSEAFGAAFKALSREKGWTQETWANATGISQANISRLMSGKSSESVRLQLAESLGLDYIDLLEMGRDILAESGAIQTPYAALTGVVNDFRAWAAGRLSGGMPWVEQVANELQILKFRFSLRSSIDGGKSKPDTDKGGQAMN
jgi:transcriptional regulator with XRE-family HTH domain